MSDANQTRIEELEKTVAALCGQVEHLESLLMIRNQKSATREAPNRPFRPDARLYKPPCARSLAPTEKRAPTERPVPRPVPTRSPAPTERPAPAQRSGPAKSPASAQITVAPTKRAAPTQPTPAPPKPSSILFDANIPKSKPNQPEPQHLRFIQTLHRDGVSKDAIADRALATYPDLCKGQGKGTEEARKAFVLSVVEIYTSKWAERYI